jgi:TPR repeat protein
MERRQLQDIEQKYLYGCFMRSFGSRKTQQQQSTATTAQPPEERFTALALDAVDDEKWADARFRVLAALAVDREFTPASLLLVALYEERPALFAHGDDDDSDCSAVIADALAEHGRPTQPRHGEAFILSLATAQETMESGARKMLVGLWAEHTGAHEEAMRWYRLSVESGCAHALYRIGCMTLIGLGTARDTERGGMYVRMTTQSCCGQHGGHAKAQYDTGQMHTTGCGSVQRVPAEAFRWFKRSAKQGYPPAMCELAACFENGFGTRCDLAEARRWFAAALGRRHVLAKEGLERVETKIKEEATKPPKPKSMAEEWCVLEALDAMDLNRWTLAIEHTLAALKADPEFVPALVLVGAFRRAAPSVFRGDDITYEEAAMRATNVAAEKLERGKRFCQRIIASSMASGARIFLADLWTDLIEDRSQEVKLY